MDPLFLTEVRKRPEHRCLRLTWSDGHTGDLDYDYVRGYCPCAACQGHGSGAIRFQTPERPVAPVGIEPVGHYAISIEWTDRHATGIYRFDFLREICPCADCLRARAERDGAPEGATPPDVPVSRLA